MAAPDVLGDGKCLKCRGPLAKSGVFHRLRLDIGGINVGALQRMQGLAQILGGGDRAMDIAAVMGPDQPSDLVRFAADFEDGQLLTTILLCNDCLLTVDGLGALIEMANAKKARDARAEAKEPATDVSAT